MGKSKGVAPRRNLRESGIRQNRPIFVQLTATDGLHLYFKPTCIIQLSQAFIRTRATHGSKHFLYLIVARETPSNYSIFLGLSCPMYLGRSIIVSSMEGFKSTSGVQQTLPHLSLNKQVEKSVGCIQSQKLGIAVMSVKPHLHACYAYYIGG